MRFSTFKKHIHTLSENAKPREEWKRETRATVLAEIRKSPLWRETGEKTPTGFWGGERLFAPKFGSMRAAFATVLVVGVIFSGSFVAVSAAQTSLPGDTLYPVKLSVEKAKIGIAFSQEKKAILQLAFAGTRLEEVSRLLEGKEEERAENIAKAMEIFTGNLNAVENRLTDSEVGFSRLVNERTTVLQENLLKIKQRINKPAAIASINASATELSAPVPDQSGAGDVVTEAEAEAKEQSAQDKIQTLTRSIASIDGALDKVDETNTKSLSTFVQEAAKSLSEQTKQEALVALQAKIQQIELRLSSVASITAEVVSEVVVDEAQGIISYDGEPVQTGLNPIRGFVEQISPTRRDFATSTNPTITKAKEALYTVKQKSNEAKKTLDEAKKIAESNDVDKLERAFEKIRETSAIIKEVDAAVKSVESLVRPNEPGVGDSGGVLGGQDVKDGNNASIEQEAATSTESDILEQ